MMVGGGYSTVVLMFSVSMMASFVLLQVSRTKYPLTELFQLIFPASGVDVIARTRRRDVASPRRSIYFK